MARVRWFGVALGFYQVWSYELLPDPTLGPRATPGWIHPAAYAVIAGFLLVNVGVHVALRRSLSWPAWRRLGLAVFAADCALLFGLVWLFSFDRASTTWVTLYILSLEGALRFQLLGALMPVAVAFPLEVIRDVFRYQQYGYPFDISSASYRVGIMALVAGVAGLMARNLERERANEQASASRERASRLESDAFHEVVLAGLAGGDFGDTIGRVVRSMERVLGYEAFAIALVEDTPEGRVLRCVGAHGFPDAIGRKMPIDEGICGAAVRTGEPQLVADTAADPRYVEWIPGIRSEMCAPIKEAGRVLGLVDVESREVGAFDQSALDRLARLAPQIGLVLTNARLFAQERAATQRLRELDQMKSDFVAITSHELRTPLTSIRGFVRTMRRPNMDPEEASTYLEIIDRQTERLTRLVEDLLVASRIEAGSVQMEPAPVDVTTLLHQAVEEMGRGSRRVALTIEPDLPVMVTDGLRFGQVIRNLLENAVKFSPDSTPVTVVARRDGGMLIVEVSDRGPGIPAAELDRIFERFYQVGGSMGRHAQGAGLGLYIARWITEALGGTIRVASEPGVGTTFTVSLPIDAVEQAAERTG